MSRKKGYKHSIESRKKMSEAQLGSKHWNFKYKKLADKNWLYQKYIVEKLSSCKIAKLLSSDSATVCEWLERHDIKRRSLSEAHKGQKAWNKGIPCSEETKRKISESEKGRIVPKGKNHHSWKGGRIIDHGRYVLIYKPGHPHAKKSGHVFEHLFVASKALGRPLKKEECAHHINGNGLDNRNCNLLICTRGYHQSLHWKMAQLYIKEHFGG